MTLKGRITGAPLISLWRHYPEVDLDLENLVTATIKDHKSFPSDIVKLSPHARYSTMDFGCKILPGTTDYGDTGASSCKECVVKSKTHWNRIETLDPMDGEYGRNVRYVEMVSRALPDVPKMMTIFSPTMVARKLSQNQFIDHLADDRKLVLDAFKIVNKVTIEYARACLDAGANGIFMATQEADMQVVSDQTHSKTILGMNAEFNKVMNQKAEFTVLHIHGDQVHFNQALESLPTTSINWHDQTSGIPIQDAGQQFSGGLLAGLEPTSLLNGITKNEVINLKRYKENFPFILSPGCVILQGTSDKSLELIFKHYRDD